MTKSLPTPRLRFVFAICAGVLFLFGAAVSAQAAPLVFSASNSTRGIALESVTMKGEPFFMDASTVFTANDTRTRITIFCMNLDFLQGEGASALTADAEDAAHVIYPLRVEYVGAVPPDLLYPSGDINPNGDFRGMYMVVLRLNDAMTNSLGDVLIRLNLHGEASNRVRVAIGTVGGGPADDPGAIPTPAPASPPSIVTPLTIAQYQAQFNDPNFPSNQDRLRFLEQVTWGPNDADLTHLQQVGMQAYLNEQFSAPISGYPDMPLYPTDPALVPAPGCDAICLRDNYSMYQLQKQLVQNALTAQDQLRQRVTFSLHKLIPVSGRDLNNQSSWVAPYLRRLDLHAFGNFRNVLFDITLNPAMGNYLDMSGNTRVNPNENYAREVMQLFSIGTDMLNQDGTPVLDPQGNRVPSYDQAAITNLARVFTGWRITNTNVTINATVLTVPDYINPMPLQNNTNTYDIQAKTLLIDIFHPTPLVLPACTNCTNAANFMAYKNTELNAAIDNLFNHPNTGPYLCTQMIHQLVTSNPTPAYVGRCSAAFANNGSGVRGDMKAVLTAILLDPEARGGVKNAPEYGQLREPVTLITTLLRRFATTSDYVVVTNSPNSYSSDLGQDVFNPPTVFSYFAADHGLPGTNLFGPEFGVLDTSTTFRRANFVNTLFLANSGNGIPANGANRPTGTQVSYASYQALAGNPQQLVDALDAALLHSTMPAATKASIVTAVTAVSAADPAGRTRTAIYLVATSAQFQVKR